MADRPYTLLSCCVSLDGYLDGGAGKRLLLSNDADFDRVDEVRASCDAILVGAQTVRGDNPRLLVRNESRRRARIARGIPATPAKVTMTRRANLDPRCNFFTAGEADKYVYCPRGTAPVARKSFGDSATVVAPADHVDVRNVCEDLHHRGIERLMVEGGGTIHTQFLTANLADELHLVIAPIFVGDSTAHRFVSDGAYPWNPGSRARLVEVRPIGDVVLLRYALSSRFDDNAEEIR